MVAGPRTGRGPFTASTWEGLGPERQLHVVLRGGCPPDLEVLLAPFDVALADDTVMQPDLLVARRGDLTDSGRRPQARRRPWTVGRAAPTLGA